MLNTIENKKYYKNNVNSDQLVDWLNCLNKSNK